MNKKNKILIVTHNGTFHADDVFACATLSLYLKSKKKLIKIIRTRDEKKIENADIVVDIGRIYDEKKNRFDHHQKGGAGKRENGVPYASFGLVWNKYGPIISGNKEVCKKIDEVLVQSIDAGDNGVDYFDIKIDNVFPYELRNIFHAFQPTWKEKDNKDKVFIEMVNFASKILEREVKKNTDLLQIEKNILSVYKKTKNKKIIVLDKPFSRFDIVNSLMKFKEPVYAIYPDSDRKDWSVVGVKNESDSFEVRKPFPEGWGGKEGEDLEIITGVPGSIFCHRALFLCSTKSKAGAIALASLALDNNSN